MYFCSCARRCQVESGGRRPGLRASITLVEAYSAWFWRVATYPRGCTRANLWTKSKLDQSPNFSLLSEAHHECTQLAFWWPPCP
ncbi:hypothetical protein ACFPRL_18205 [Pseudoclavibacter helvolus]